MKKYGKDRSSSPDASKCRWHDKEYTGHTAVCAIARSHVRKRSAGNRRVRTVCMVRSGVKKCATTTRRWWGTESRWRNDRSVLRRDRSVVLGDGANPGKYAGSTRTFSNRIDSTRLDLTSRQLAGRRGSSSGRTSWDADVLEVPLAMRLTPSAISIAVPACPFSKWRGEGTVEIRCSGAAATIPAGTPSRRFLVHARDPPTVWAQRENFAGAKWRTARTMARTYAGCTHARVLPKKLSTRNSYLGVPSQKYQHPFVHQEKKRRTAKFDDRSEVMPHSSRRYLPLEFQR